MVGLGETLMAKKGRPKSNRSDATTKIDRYLLEIAHLVAKKKGISVAELLSEIVRNPLQREYDELVLDIKKRRESK